MSTDSSDLHRVRRRITDCNGNCKPTNTFIEAKFTSVKHVCRAEGENIGGDNYKSKNKFKIVVCKGGRGKPPHCEYNSVRYDDRNIVVGCNEKREPVHFVRVLPDESE
uniref:Ribonuclease A-domain domain-containing protein n=1 Tax=Sander lucioperca TaxID=283035 RepID=A0A8C9XYY2_SANLU